MGLRTNATSSRSTPITDPQRKTRGASVREGSEGGRGTPCTCPGRRPLGSSAPQVRGDPAQQLQVCGAFRDWGRRSLTAGGEDAGRCGASAAVAAGAGSRLSRLEATGGDPCPDPRPTPWIRSGAGPPQARKATQGSSKSKLLLT